MLNKLKVVLYSFKKIGIFLPFVFLNSCNSLFNSMDIETVSCNDETCDQNVTPIPVANATTGVPAAAQPAVTPVHTISPSPVPIVIPVFTGGGTLNISSPANNSVSLSFTAIDNTAVAQYSGASKYNVYLTSIAGVGTPADPCASSTFQSQINASSYTSGQTVNYTIANLNPRTTYAACVKAENSAGVSATTTKLNNYITTQDLTPPAFSGVTSVSYSQSNLCVNVTWEASSSLDVKEYKVVLYTTAIPATKITKTIAAPATSTCQTHASLAELGSIYNQTINASVEACDDASPLYGSQNCTTANLIQNVVVQDTQGPQNFSGITSVSASSPLITGAVTINWTEPAAIDRADYRGYKVYDVPCIRAANCPNPVAIGNLVELKDCACSANSCPLHETSCQVTGLNAYRRYDFYVRAYDQFGNYTAISAVPTTINRKTDDIIAPTFSSALSATWVIAGNATCTAAGNGICVGWSAATDNQYNGESNTITYKVYRHTSAITFDGNNLPTNGTLVSTQTSTSYKNTPASLSENTIYYYTVCAMDQAKTDAFLNAPSMICDKAVVNATTGDLTAPTFAGGGTLTRGSPVDSNLDISFTALNNQNDAPATGISHYKIYISSAAGVGTPTDPCSTGTYYNEISALTGNGGGEYDNGDTVNYTITGRSERNTYAVCVKARDLATNISTTTTKLTTDVTSYDVTAPTFAGITGVSYDQDNLCVNVTWNANLDPDLKEYKVVFYTSATPATKIPKTITAPATSTCQTHASLASLGSIYNQTVNAYVDACDNASPLYGSQNCSDTHLTTLNVLVQDTKSPQNFSGITSVGASSPSVNGAVTVNWTEPAAIDRTDFRGYKVYDIPCVRTANCPNPVVVGNLVELQDCACSSNGCPSHETSCQVTGLDIYRRYDFYIRAYDNFANYTAIAASPTSINRKTDDVSSPTFTSALTASAVLAANGTCAAGGFGICLGWNTASDNQYNGESNTITYKVYRHTASITFDGNDLPTNGAVLTTTTSTNYKDLSGTAGVTYYYTVCAEDSATTASSSNNAGKKCDKVVSNAVSPYELALNPTNPIATVNSISQITLSWTSGGAGTADYQISYQTGASAPNTCADGTPISETAITGVSHQVTGLATATQYSFRICAINANPTPDVTTGVTVSATTLQDVPSEPTGLTSLGQSADSVVLNWTSGGGYTSDYRISYQTGATAPASCALGTQISEAAVNGTTYIVTGLSPAQQYSFRVCAINSNPTPNESSGVTVTATTLGPDKETFVQIVSNSSFGCGLSNLGKAYCWGNVTYGQLGSGAGSQAIATAVDQSALPAGESFISIDLGTNTACGLTNTGKVYCWGYDAAEELGNGIATTNQPTPVAVDTTNLAAGETFISLSVKGSNGCGLSSLGKVYCWGINNQGQVGRGSGGAATYDLATTVDRSIVTAGESFVSQTTGNGSSCAITNAGNTYCWGFNMFAGVGNGTTTNPQPKPVLNSATNLVAGESYISTTLGYSFGCGVTNTGKVYCWGRNSAGQVGTNGAGGAQIATPVAVVITNLAAGESFLSIKSTHEHTCGVTNLGKGFCWGGANASGQLGRGDTNTQYIPAEVTQTGLSYGEKFIKISPGEATTCALTNQFKPYCWGASVNNQMAIAGAAGNYLLPTKITETNLTGAVSFIATSVGTNHTCALTNTNKTYCWGSDTSGQLGNGATAGDQDSPSLVDMSNLPFGMTFTSVTTGAEHTCGLTYEGKAYCWGSDTSGQLGNGATTGDQLKPVAVVQTNLAVGESFKSISAGSNHTCGLTNTGKAFCWGLDSSEQLGNGATTGIQEIPVAVDQSSVTSGESFTSLTAGGAHTCAITNKGKAFCWGDDTYEQIGNGATTGNQIKPVAVTLTNLGANVSFYAITAGANHTCGLSSSYLPYCWGSDSAGQLGNGATAVNQNIPILVDTSGLPSGERLIKISANASNTCGLTNTRKSVCWGSDSAGQAGNGATTGDVLIPTLVDQSNLASGSSFVSISTGGTHTCAINPVGTIFCWGDDTNGQLGNGATTGNQTIPGAVNQAGL